MQQLNRYYKIIYQKHQRKQAIYGEQQKKDFR